VFLDGTCNPGPPPSYYHLTVDSFRRDLPFRAAHVCNRLVSGAFHPHSGVLFSFLSPYYCAIGLETYLVLGVSVFRLSAPKLGYGIPGLQLSFFRFMPTGLSPSLAGLSRPLLLCRLEGSRAYNPTFPMSFPMGFSLDFSLFARCYWGNPVLVSFPSPTKMLPFGEFPLPCGSIMVPKNHNGRSH
jgi:hypothetical protein